jgi:hypothetical protein
MENNSLSSKIKSRKPVQLIVFAFEEEDRDSLSLKKGHSKSHLSICFLFFLARVCEYVVCPYNQRKMLDLQHQYNNCTTIPHMRVGPTYWGPSSCEGLLYSCCIGVVQESNPITKRLVKQINKQN